MLFLAAGFVLTLAVPFLLLLAFVALPFFGEGLATLVSQTSQVAGLLLVVYALRMPA
jgi:hypothetical protein